MVDSNHCVHPYQGKLMSRNIGVNTERNILNFGGKLFVFFFALYPYVFVTYMVFPLEVFSSNIYFGITTLFFIGFFLYLLSKYEKLDIRRLVFFIVLTYCIFLLIHLLTLDSLHMKSLMSNRIGISSIFYMFIALGAVSLIEINILSKIIIFNALVQAIVGIIHYHFFSHIVTGSSLVPAGQYYVILNEPQYLREPGLLISASLYAHMVLLGILLLGYKLSEFKPGFKAIVGILVLSVLLYALLLSHSRFPSVIGFLFSLYVLVQLFKGVLKFNIITLALFASSVPLIVLVFTNYIYPEIESISHRVLYEGMGVRTVKNLLALNVILESPIHLLFGADPEYIGTISSSDGVGISDNSFLAIGMEFGLIYLLLVIMCAALVFYLSIKISKRTLFLILIFIVNLFLTNSIYWDIYLLYFFVTLYIVASKDKDRCKLTV